MSRFTGAFHGLTPWTLFVPKQLLALQLSSPSRFCLLSFEVGTAVGCRRSPAQQQVQQYCVPDESCLSQACEDQLQAGGKAAIAKTGMGGYPTGTPHLLCRPSVSPTRRRPAMPSVIMGGPGSYVCMIVVQLLPLAHRRTAGI